MIYEKGTLIKHRKGYTEVADGSSNYGSAWSVSSGSDSSETKNSNPQDSNNGRIYVPSESTGIRNIESPVNSNPTPTVTRVNNNASIGSDQVDPEITRRVSEIASQIEALTQGVKKFKTDSSNASNINQSPNLNIPDVAGESPSMSNQFSSIDSYQKLLDANLEQTERARKDYEEKQKEYEAEKESWMSKLSGNKTTNETMADYFESIGVKPEEYFNTQKADLAAIQSLQEQYTQMEGQKQQALLAEENRKAPMDYINKRMTTTEKEWNIKLNTAAAGINVKLGIMEAKRDNFAQAEQYVNQAVQNYTYDLNLQLQQYKEFENINQEQLDRLDSKYTNALAESKNIIIAQMEEKKANLTSVLNLAMQYPDASWPSDLSALTLEQATEIARNAPASMEWSEPFSLGNDIVQQNLKTGEIKTAASTGSGSDSGLSQYQLFGIQNTLQDNARQDPNISTFSAVRSSYETARSAKDTKNSAGDIVLMRTLAKITDPTTGVREEEYRTFQDAVGTLPRYGVNLTTQMIGTGQLTETGRKRLFEQVEDIYNQKLAAYENSVKYWDAQAGQYDLPSPVPKYVAPSNTSEVTDGQITNTLNDIVLSGGSGGADTGQSSWYDKFLGVFGLKKK